MLALGDALAIATMAARGVTNAHLRQLHPGGSIGLSLVTVADIMHHGDAMPLVPLAMPMREVLLEMTEKSLGIAGVVDRAGHLVGAISDGDLRRHVHGLLTACAEDVMTRTRARCAPTPAPEKRWRSCRKRRCLRCSWWKGQSDLPIGVLHLHDLGRLGLN
jgi:arabinose-5-phosphate isomerase